MNTEIAEYIKNHIREYLPPEYQEAHITLEEVTKGNDRRLTGLMIRNDGEITVPTIYLEPMPSSLRRGGQWMKSYGKSYRSGRNKIPGFPLKYRT